MSHRVPKFFIGAAVLAAACTPPAETPRTPPSEPEKQEAQASVDPRYAELPAPGPAPEWTPPEAEKLKLENGLTVWHMPHGSAPLVSVHLVLSSGSAEDPEGKEGLSVLAADLLDEGAGDLSALELSDRLGELATEYSSSGGVDSILLSMDSLAENLEPSLALLADIVQRPKLSRDEFERRKKHYEAAALAARDDPHEARSKGLYQVLFSDGYGSGPPTGTVESLSTISYTDVKRRALQMTVPDQAHLTFAGAVEKEQIEELAKKYFGDWKGERSFEQTSVSEPPKGGVAYVVDFPSATQSSLAVAMRAGQEGDPNHIAEEVMQEKLGGSFTGRINMNLREDKGYTYGAFSYFRRFRRAGYFAVVADVKSETTAASIAEVFSELSAVCKERPLSEKERDSAVAGMLLGYPLDFDEVSSTGYRLAALPMKGRPVDYWTTWPERVRSVTTERANEAAQPYCHPQEYVVIVVGDEKSVTPGLEELGLTVHTLDRDGKPKAHFETKTASAPKK